jgi:ADP-ribosylglycohydrolase
MENRPMDRYRVPTALAWPDECCGPFDASAYRDRCVGALVAGALGDGLGGPVEGSSREKVLARYGPAGITDLPDAGASWSDDTQLTALVGESLVTSGGRFDPDDLVPRLVRWLPTGRGLGRATRSAIAALARGEPWERVGPALGSSGNGAAMRTAPVALVHALARTPGRLLADAVSFALPTHGGEVGVAGAVAMAAGIAYLARRAVVGATTLDPFAFVDFLGSAIVDLETAPTRTRRPPGEPVYLRDRLRAIPSWLDRDPVDVFAETWTGAFALESVPAAIYAFLRAPADPRTVLLTGANAGHDTDTIASMAGNLVGAWLGAGALAAGLPDWWGRIERRDELADLGERLAALGLAMAPGPPDVGGYGAVSSRSARKLAEA